jgi:hypothetical protein
MGIMSAKFHLVDAAAVMEREENQNLSAKGMALHLSVAQIIASLAWVEHHTEKLRVTATDNVSSTLGEIGRAAIREQSESMRQQRPHKQKPRR